MPNTTNPSLEEWRPVVGWEGLYEVCDLGWVRSLDRVVQFGSQQRHVRGRVLRPGRQVNGALFVFLSNGKRKKVRTVHQLVLEAFVGPRPVGLEGCHWNDVKTDNRLENLRYDTHSANGLDCIRNGHNPQLNKTHCPQKHEYTPENTRIGKNGGRWCRECKRIDGRARYWGDIDNQRRRVREAKRRQRQANREPAA